MKPLIRRAAERGHFKNEWLDTRYAFSFSDYYDEAWMGFRTLRVINEDIVKPGKGFDLHGHRDMEILTYVMQGSLRHVDTMGNTETLNAGEFQLMTAGTGVQHMELNASQTEDCHLYQIWILPDQRNLEPGYAQKSFADRLEKEGKVLIVSPDARDGSLKIHQDAEVRLYRLEAGETVKIEVSEGKGCWMQIVSGDLHIEDQKLSASDGAGFMRSLDIEAMASAEALVFIL